ncbi:hypothetical protein BT67DRAFT_313311 [Trichocladium antarcticum]|uniref:Uncharacterized protein n=1 Tax=Trichocladium antarcticum TaxID=1450529 RepID=A0AAN6ZDX7_9PEZI|nr:hypothetical protein BT67DRAFT_313311 [Trichocladium antarcticum]
MSRAMNCSLLQYIHTMQYVRLICVSSRCLAALRRQPMTEGGDCGAHHPARCDRHDQGSLDLGRSYKRCMRSHCDSARRGRDTDGTKSLRILHTSYRTLPVHTHGAEGHSFLSRGSCEPDCCSASGRASVLCRYPRFSYIPCVNAADPQCHHTWDLGAFNPWGSVIHAHPPSPEGPASLRLMAVKARFNSTACIRLRPADCP